MRAERRSRPAQGQGEGRGQRSPRCRDEMTETKKDRERGKKLAAKESGPEELTEHVLVSKSVSISARTCVTLKLKCDVYTPLA